MSTFVSALALLLALGGCGGSSGGVAADPTPAAAETVPSASGPSDADLAAFAEAFNRKFPALAAGRPSRSVADDADNTCLDLAQGAEKQVVLKHVQARFGTDQTVSPKTAGRILALVKSQACPR